MNLSRKDIQGVKMNKEIFKGNWHELKGLIKEQWAEITDKDLDKINGKFEKMLGYLEKNYGYSKEAAEEKISELMKQQSRLYAQGSKKIAKVCDHYLHDIEACMTKKPLQSALIAFGLGILVDRLISLASSNK